MSKTLYPKANATLQYFVKKFPGSTMTPNVVVLHSTEGFDWPSYGGGATAPNMTMKPDFKNKKLLSRQHIPANKSSRALENRPGGVQTNTLNAFQIELTGTCDSRYKKRWGSKVAGVDYIYWPDAPDWALRDLGEVMTWLNKEWPSFPIKDGAPRGWVVYPDSYGLSAKQRMSFAEWNNGRGIVGHQHVPENSHGDPGNMNIKRLIEIIKGAPVVLPNPEKPVIDPKALRLTSMTYNVVAEVAHVGLAKFTVRVPHIVDFVEEAMPDVLYLQEAGDAKVHKPLRDQLEDAGYKLLILKNWRAIYYRASTVERKAGWRRGHLVMAGAKVDGVADTKVVVYGLLQLKASKTPFWALSTHLSHRASEGEWRLKQGAEMRGLVKTLQKVKSAPVILGGDFNSSAQVVDAFVKQGWVSGGKAKKTVSWEYDTLNKLTNPPLKNSDHVDHLVALAGGGLVPKPVRWEQFGNISKGLYVKPFPADHNPVLVEWELVKA